MANPFAAGAALTNPLSALTMLPGLFGGQQVGPAAPAFNTGMSAGVSALSPAIGGGITGLLGNLMQQMPLTEESNPVTDAVRDAAPAQTMPGSMKDPNKSPEANDGFFNTVFNNLDQGFQSPSRMIGLGLLNQIDPRLAMGGAALQGLGLLGGQKVF